MKKIVLVFLLLSVMNMKAQTTFQKVFNSTSNSSYITAHDITSTSDGGNLTTTLVGNYADSLLIVKSDGSGNIQWSKVITNLGSNSIMPSNIIESPVGGYCIVLSSFAGDSISGWIESKMLHFDLTGNITWQKSYSGPNAPFYGNAKIHIESNGNFLIVFSIYDRICLLRTDNSGNIIWSQSYTSDINEPKNPGFDAATCSDGGILASGKANSDIFLVKLSSTGQVQWTKRFNTYSYDHPNIVIQAIDGTNIVAGYDQGNFNSMAYLMKIDNNGNVIWFKTYSPLSEINKVLQMANGYLGILADNNVIVVTDQNGDPVISKNFGSTNIIPLQICRTNSDDLIAAGCIYDPTTLSTSNFVFQSSWMSMLWCGATDYPITVTTENYNPIITTGTYALLNGFISGTSQQVICSNYSCSVSDYCATSGIADQITDSQINIFPNPISTTATIQLDASSIKESTNFILYDMLGKEVMKQKITSEKTEISRGDLNAGIYFYKISSGDGIIKTGKLVISEK